MNNKIVLRVTVFLVIIAMGMLFIKIFPDIVAKESEQSDKVRIVATLFPQYDFARQIAGDKADINLVISPGMESHSYDPSPNDIIKMNSADLFIYTGQSMEPWAERIIEGLPEKVIVVDASANIAMDRAEEGGHEHEHAEDEHVEGEHEHIEGEDDPHIWTDPLQAKIMVDTIAEALCKSDPENSEYYIQNAENYKNELEDLHKDFQNVVEMGKRKEMIFGGRFALYYFAKRYDLSVKSAYEYCSIEGEPSPKVVAELIDYIKEHQVPVIYFEELSDPKVAKTIAENTDAEMLLFHSCHNVSKDEFAGGETYISLMRQNLANLEEGLN